MTEDNIVVGQLAKALAAFQAEVPRVEKGRTGTIEGSQGKRGYSYDYADLADVTAIAMPMLGKHGLAFTSRPTLMGGAFVLDYALMHEGGEVLEGIYPLGDPLSTLPQKLGSAITYARRYAFCAVTGIAPGGDDDDAASANDTPAAAATPKTTRSRKAKAEAPEPVAPAVTNWTLAIADARSVDDLRAIHAQVEDAGELGLPFDPAFRTHVEQLAEQWKLETPPPAVTVAQMLNAVRKAIESKPAPADEEPEPPAEDAPGVLAEEWDVAPIPEGGEG